MSWKDWHEEIFQEESFWKQNLEETSKHDVYKY